MNVNKSSFFWGMLLIVGGGLALAQQMGYVDRFSLQVGIYSFAAIGLVALVMYALSGFKEWGWLFPAGIFGGLAVTITLATSNVDTAAVGSPLFIGLLIPFLAAYLTDRPRNWWALIPGGVMVFLTLVTLLVDSIGGEWIGTLFLFMGALSFLIVYLNNSTRTWALLVAYILGVLSIAPALASGGEEAAYFGPIFLFAVALPFFIVYFRNVDKWWAIIPAGVLTTIAVIAAFAIGGFINDEKQGGLVNAFLMGGLAATFAVLWLRHSKAWARIVTVVLAALAVASVFFATYAEILWPLAIILAGGYLLYTALRSKTA